MNIAYPASIYDSEYDEGRAIIRTHWQWVLLALGLVFLFTLPLYLSGELIRLANFMGISVIVALGVHILTGCAGVINFGQAGFMCIGAYTTAIICSELGWSFWVGLVCGILSCGIVGLFFSLISLQVKQVYLMVVTLAAGIIIPMFIQVVVLPHLGITVAGMRGASPSVGGRVLKTPEEVFSIIMPFMVALTFLVVNLGRTRIGRILSSIKYNDLASEVLGVNLSFYRLLAFSICCVLAGIGGSLWNCYMPMITLGKFSYMESIWYLGIIIIGGLGSIAGVFMGSIIVRLTEFLVSSRFIPWASGMIYEKAYLPPWLISHLTGVTSLLLSMIILSFLMFAPWGVIHRWERFRIFYRSWPLVREYSGNKKWQ